MSDEAAVPTNPSDERIRQILQEVRRIAVVGISDKADRASHGIARFLIGRGYDVVGINPVLKEVLGRPVYPTLSAAPAGIELVDVFRRSEAVPPVVDEAITCGARVIWLQKGIVHEEAAARARGAGVEFVQDRCIYKEWLRLLNG